MSVLHCDCAPSARLHAYGMDEQIDMSGLGPLMLPVDPSDSRPREDEAIDGRAPESAPVAVAESGNAPLGAQLDFPPAMDLSLTEEGRRPLKFGHRTPESAAFARQAKEAKRAKTQAAAAASELAEASGALQAITTLLPGAAALVGQPKVQHIERKRAAETTPSQFVVLTRAAHLGSASKLSLGIRHKRVIRVAADLLLRRQRRGLRGLLGWARNRSKGSSSRDPTGGERKMHFNYTHLWDETKVRHGSKHAKLKGQRRSRMGISGHTLVQRGGVSWCLGAEGASPSAMLSEPWLALPMQVDSTSAEGLCPAISDSLPPEFSFASLSEMCALAKEVGTITFLPMSDKASGNVKILRMWAAAIEQQAGAGVGDAGAGEQRVLYFPDTCGIHIVARGKLVLKELRMHVMRHYSISNLSRLHHIGFRMMANMEALISKKVRRVVGTPPAGMVGLEALVDILFDMGAAHHRRGKCGGHSLKWQALQSLFRVVNGDLRSKIWTHFCWDPATGRPCCKSQAHCAERTTAACIDALLTEADPIAAESRWTHVLSNMRKTVLRRAVCSVGIECVNVGVCPACCA